MIDVTQLPPEARLTLTQEAVTDEQGLRVTIRGTGWAPPHFGVDWSQENTLKPLIPLPGGLASLTGRFNYQEQSSLESGTVSWSITSRQGTGSSEGDEQSSVTITLLNKGWQILRSMNGTAIPMRAYSKRQVSANGVGVPPVSANALTQTSFAGITILVTSYSYDTTTQRWEISGEEP